MTTASTLKPLVGPSYRDLVSKVAALKKARNYMEIGVHNGSTIHTINCEAIGVDPKFVLKFEPVGAKPALHLYQMTSDDFFKAKDPRAIFGAPVDVSFLDGLHLFEFLLRDFIGAERVSARDSLILMDDCFPRNIEMAERDHRPALRQDKQRAGWWTGDVWKVVSILRKYRPDLTLTCVDVVPTGSVIVSGLDPDSTVLQGNYEEIIAQYSTMELTADLFEQHWSVNKPVPIADALQTLSRYWS